jgi:hypothetical protein
MRATRRRDQLHAQQQARAGIRDIGDHQPLDPDEAANVILHPLSSQLRDLNHREAFRGQRMSLSSPSTPADQQDPNTDPPPVCVCEPA